MDLNEMKAAGKPTTNLDFLVEARKLFDSGRNWRQVRAALVSLGAKDMDAKRIAKTINKTTRRAPARVRGAMERRFKKG